LEDLIGRPLGPYQVTAPLGEGGMAAVYKAFQPSMDRYVALKILPRYFASDPQFVGRFEQEAKVIARLQHPHILPVFDFGEADGYTYIVMPFVEGGTLADLLEGQPLPLAQIERVIGQVGDALAYAHSRGVVHRDVKPSNILIDPGGNCLLTDFGVAKIVEGTAQFTRTGGIVGTPAYMSPEQIQGQELDGRSDIYSLGIVLYEMATGRPPYRAETPPAIFVKHLHDPLPPPRTLNPALPEEIERVILKALAKNRDDRHATAGDLVQAVRAAVGAATIAADRSEAPGQEVVETLVVAERPPATVPVSTPATTSPHRPANPKWILAIIGVVILLGVIGLIGLGGRLAGKSGGDEVALGVTATPAVLSPVASGIVVPNATDTPVPTQTPVPAKTSTPSPTKTPLPTETSMPVPSPISTATAVPTDTPQPTGTPVPEQPTAAPTAGPDIIFRDDFDGALAAGWGWVREDATHWNLREAPGSLRIVAQAGGVGTIQSAPANNLLVREAPQADFEIATLVRFNPSSNFQFAGLLIYQDDSNAILFGRAFCDIADVCVGNGIYLDSIQAGEFGPDNYATSTANQSSAYLRLKRKGDTYTGYYSEDGANWRAIGQHSSSLTPARVGLIASQAYEAETGADFDYFAIETRAAESTAVPLPGPETVPLSNMTSSIPWLPLDESALPATYYYGFNVAKPPFDNRLVRQAFAAAVDRQAIADLANSLGINDVRPATTFTPPETLGRDLYGQVGLPFDPGRARELLAQAGYPNGAGFPTVNLVFNYLEGHQAVADAVVSMWRENLGVTVELDSVDNWDVYIERLNTDAPAIFRLGWTADYNDPDNFLLTTFHSTSEHARGKNFANSEFDKLVEQAVAAAGDPATRQAQYIQAERVLCEREAAIIPLYHFQTAR
jgi:serine/threonine protein kinase